MIITEIKNGMGEAIEIPQVTDDDLKAEYGYIFISRKTHE